MATTTPTGPICVWHVRCPSTLCSPNIIEIGEMPHSDPYFPHFGSFSLGAAWVVFSGNHSFRVYTVSQKFVLPTKSDLK